MSMMMRWQPLSEMMSLRQAMDRMFEDFFVHPSRLTGVLDGREIPLDIYQTADSVVVKAALPGVKPEEVDISVSGDTLTIRGERKAENEIKSEGYIYQERRYGAFSRTVILPGSLHSDKAEATFENGILTLTIPKAEEVKPKKIHVKTKGAIEGKKKA